MVMPLTERVCYFQRFGIKGTCGITVVEKESFASTPANVADPEMVADVLPS